ncbi:MAG: noncanonical pyrimidine nucleotidase, YjjG family [Sphingobacteriia bacterium]|nr:MAG: noncanonical pyrimidine nucleotidase, YjjG family [Sphingobacteriia bacterium]
MHYRHLFFDLDHTLWDFDTNSREALADLFEIYQLHTKGVTDFNSFFEKYSHHNHHLWDKYSKGLIRQEELRWKRMWLSLLDFKLADEALSRKMGAEFLELLPTKNKLFPYTIEILNYLTTKGYALHLITNGFEKVQYHKLAQSNIDKYFKEVVTSEGSNSLKPNKAIFDYALKSAGALAVESIMIGDNLEADIKGGINAGLDTIFVNHIQAQTTLKPTYTIYHLAELETIF